GTAAAEPVDAIGGADTDVGAGAEGRYLRPPHRAAVARRTPELRLAEAVAEVELDADAGGRRLHQVRQPVAVHVDEVVVQARPAPARLDAAAETDVVGRLLTEDAEREPVGIEALVRRGGAERDVEAVVGVLADLARVAAELAGEAGALAAEHAVGQRRLDAGAADHVRIAVAVEIEEVDVAAGGAVGRANTEAQAHRERGGSSHVSGTAGLDDARGATEAGAVAHGSRNAVAETGRAHQAAGREGAAGARLPTRQDLRGILRLEGRRVGRQYLHRVGARFVRQRADEPSEHRILRRGRWTLRYREAQYRLIDRRHAVRIGRRVVAVPPVAIAASKRIRGGGVDPRVGGQHVAGRVGRRTDGERRQDGGARHFRGEEHRRAGRQVERHGEGGGGGGDVVDGN